MAQSETAEQSFRKIEEAIEGAKTISIRMKYQRGGSVEGKADLEKENVKVGCTILVREGNEVNISTESSWVFTSPTDLAVISNGNRMRTTDAFGITKEGKSPTTLTASLKTILARPGFFAAQHFIPRGATLAKEAEPDLKNFLEKDQKKIFEVTNLRSGGEGKDRWIRYALRVADGDAPIEVTLWYDPKTYKPTKRRVLLTLADLNATITHLETYDEFNLNGEILDDKFKLPSK